ncbi:MAG: MATE family efflux transporter [Lachnospiraceae bacterium]|nr:MATE family efflux transporter [Lachnospiraceae bacterium]
MKKNEQLLQKGSFIQMVTNLCVPTIVIMLVMVIYNMADTYFIGKTGDPSKIAAVSLCGPIFSILSGLGTLLGSGGCTAVSLALGKKEYNKIKSYTSLCCYGSLAIGFIFSAAVLTNLKGISTAIGANADTLEYTGTYLRILALGGPVILFGNVVNNLIRADGSAKQAMISNGLGTIVNIILDPLLILGFEMGVAGAAAATVTGNIISFLYLFWYIKKKQTVFSLSIRDLSLKKEIVLPIVSLGLPLACSTIMMSFSHMFMNHILAGYGSVTVAASGVAGKVSMVVSMVAMGVCMGLQPAISYNYGAGEYSRMYRIMRNLGIMTIIVGSILTAGCLIGKRYLVAMFIEHDEVIRLGEEMVVASMLMGPFYGLYQLCTTFLQSTGKASYATVVALLDKGIIYLPMLFGLNALFGLNGVIYTAPFTDMLSLLVGAVLCLVWNRTLRAPSC